MKKYFLITRNIFVWLIVAIITLLLLVFIFIQVPYVQNIARKKVVTYLENKIKTKVEIKKLSFDFPKLLVLEDVYFEDRNRDTLLAGDTLKVDISLFKLLKKEVQINDIDLRGIRANINRTMPDSIFNFDYIVKAFVSEQKKEPKPQDTTAAMKFSLDKINLDRINISYKNAVTANDVDFHLGHFDTRIKKFDLDKMKFAIPKMVMSDVNAKIIQRKPPLKNESPAKVEADSNKPFNLDLNLGIIDLKNIHLNYQNDISALKSDINLGKLLVEVDSINLKKQRIALKNLLLNDSRSIIVLGKTMAAKIVAKQSKQEVKAQLNNNWRVNIKHADWNNNNLNFDNFNLPQQKTGLDYAHLGISDLNVKAEDFYYSLDTISGNIGNISFRNKSGFILNELRTNFLYGPKGAYLNKLYIKTPKTRLQDYLKISYPSLESISKDLGAISIQANLVNSQLSLKDILTFAPNLANTDPFKRNPNTVIKINSVINGKVSDLNIPKLQISGLSNTRINASAHITGLPDMKKANFNVKLEEFSSSANDINNLVSKGMIPATIRLPDSFNLVGAFSGMTSNFKTYMLLSSHYGSAKVMAQMNGKYKGAETFNARMQFTDFNIGKLMKQEANLGHITANAQLAGTGTDPKYMSANFNAMVQSIELKGYNYKNTTFKGTLAKQNITAFAKMNDRNLAFNLNAKANIQGKYPSVNLTLDVDSANFQNLKLYKDDLRFCGKITANLPSTNPNRLIGNIDASNLLIVSKGKRYQLDSIHVAATATGDQKDLRIRSEFLSANLTGQYNLTEIGNVFTNEINKYFKIADGKQLPVATENHFTFGLKIINRPILQSFIPLLTRLDTIKIGGSYNTEIPGLKVDGFAPLIVYNGNTLENARFNTNTSNDALNYSLSLDRIITPSLQINKTSLDGKAQNNQLNLNLNIKDKNDKNKYRLAGLFSVLANQYQFSFNPDGLMLNYQPWTLASDNNIQFGKQGILAHNFELSSGGQKLSINSNPAQLNAPLKVDFTDFKIATLTAIAQKDSLLADGLINGNVLFSNLNTNPVFVSDLLVKDFTFRADTVGDLGIKVNNSKTNTYAAQVNITGKGNDVLLDGEYYIKPQNTSSFDFDLHIKNINLASIEGLTMGNLKNASGNINGDLKLTGTASAPNIRGDVNFNKAAFNIAMLNAYYRINDDKISFTNRGIELDNFTLTDSIGNKAVIDGAVYTTNYTAYKFGLNVKTDNFKVLSSSKKDNKLFYGNVFLNSDLRIRGDMHKPEVDGSIKINDKTDFTVVLPQSNPGIVERDGIVEFFDASNPKNSTALTSGLDTLNKSGISGLDVAVNIEVDSNAVFNIIVDEGNGDFLRVKGAAQLTAGIDPSGKVNLTGTYQLSQGSYELSFNFIKRKFDIQKRSTITWTGEPTTADINVTAIYVANAAPIDLVQDQIDEPAASLVRYKQKLPFEVYLAMVGQLLKPEITFDISLPTDKNYNVARDVIDNVQARLSQLKSQPSELNKQVFALLLLNRFVGEDPFAIDGGGGAESLVRSSVSKILSEELNKLAGNLIEGVDLNFDLVSTEDYTTGALQNRTDLNVGLSKQLLNDRLKVSIGSNFELEGPRSSNQAPSNIAGNIELTYQLSKDGRYMLRAYRKNEFQGVIDGYIIETGVGFVITLDYNKFKDILHRSEEQKQAKKQLRENQKLEKEEKKQIPSIEN